MKFNNVNCFYGGFNRIQSCEVCDFGEKSFRLQRNSITRLLRKRYSSTIQLLWKTLLATVIRCFFKARLSKILPQHTDTCYIKIHPHKTHTIFYNAIQGPLQQCLGYIMLQKIVKQTKLIQAFAFISEYNRKYYPSQKQMKRY